MDIQQEKLDRILSDNDIDEIASKYLTNWEKLRSRLGLTRADEECIRKSFKQDYERQGREFLYKWKELKGDSATYRSLINAAEKAQNKNLADNIRRHFPTSPCQTGIYT